MKEKIYVIPGLMTDSRLWSRIEPLLDNFNLIHIAIPNLEDFDEINDYLLKILKDEKDKINLLGFSLGGYIAFYFAYRFKNRVKKLFLVASTPSASDEKEIEKRKEKITQIQENGFEGLSYVKALSLVEDKSDEKVINLVCDMFNSLGEKSFINQLNATFNRKDYLEELINLDILVYLSYSSNDRLLNQEAIEELENKKHKIKMFKRKGISHLLPLEVPKSLANEIIEWMIKIKE